MEKIKIIHFGDSLTKCINLQPRKSWPYLSEDVLKKIFKEIISLEVLNKGVNGDNTRKALERMQADVQFEKPNIVTIQFGTNDSTYLMSNKGAPIVSELAFEANLIEMISRAKTFDIKQIIFQTNHSFFKDRVEINGKTHNENMQNYNQIIRDVATEYRCELIDLNKAFSDIDPKIYTFPPPDGVHLNERGCELYAQEITSVLEKAINSLKK